MAVAHPSLLLIGFAVALAVFIAIGRVRSRGFAACLALAMVALTCALADVAIDQRRRPMIEVLVDCSASTRGQPFRDRATLLQSVARLAPDADVRLRAFADSQSNPLPGDATLPDTASAATRLPASSADAVLLFSDGRIEPPTNVDVPIFSVMLEAPASTDARIASARMVEDRLLVTVQNNGPPRTLDWGDGSTTAVPAGNSVLSHIAPASSTILWLNAGDLWPENDALTVRPADRERRERWWITTADGRAAPAGFRAIDSSFQPLFDQWLNASAIVLDNLPMAALPADSADQFSRYVRDLGGALIVTGGDRSFSAGGYGGTALDTLLPLSSRAPTPRARWTVLVDASGSMASRTDDGRSRLERAVDAARQVVRQVPEQDEVAVGSFARDLRWWPIANGGRTTLEAPADLSASGPTNLSAAIERALERRGGLPAHLILLTDGQATIETLPQLADSIRTSGTRLHWIALGDRTAAANLVSLINAAGGDSIDAGDPANWTQAAQQAVAQATHEPPEATAIVQLTPAMGGDAINVENLNRVYPRERVEALGTATIDGESRVVLARWPVGLGQVTAAAFATPETVVQKLVQQSERRPLDPRFQIEWTDDTVTVTAAGEEGQPLNRVALTLGQSWDDRRRLSSQLEQIAPGRYHGAVARDSTPSVATISLDGQTPLSRIALPGRADREFQGIGVDVAALRSLARATGGALVDGTAALPLKPVGSIRPIRTPALLTAILLLAAGLWLDTRLRLRRVRPS